ncbi:MAG: glycosyltransferase family 9 protein, partial [Aliarcobacter sp.]|nr:glycosyltransferase family 9 protein [Aliarcobacter sp.]
DIQLSVLSGCEYILKHPTNSPLKKYLSYDFKPKLHHTIEDRIEILKLINAKEISKKLIYPLAFNESIENKIDKLLNSNKKIVGYQIGAADVYKMWPIENFIDLGKKILDFDDKTIIVITGIEKEFELAEIIVNSLGKRVLNLCGTCNIEELPYLLKRMNILITNDTGTMHLAIAIDTPTISLFSTTNSVLSGPYHDFDIHNVIQKDGLSVQTLPKKDRTNDNMKLISTKDVFKKYCEKYNSIMKRK